MHPLTKYFYDSKKDHQTGCIGLEVEHFIIHKDTGLPMPYHGISKLMDYLAPYFSKKIYEEQNLIALESEQALITLEPGCQLEISITCLNDLDLIQDIYQKNIDLIQGYLKKSDYRLVYSGGLPTVTVNQVQRIDKKRYEFMERYFLKSGTRGLEMMKATAAVHVSIDYADEKDFVQKYRMANILHPIFAFLCANTKFYAGKKNHDVLLRDAIWQHTDSSRCGIIPSLFEENFGFKYYTDWILKVPLILMYDGSEFVSVGHQTLEEVAQKEGWSRSYISHYLSMSFLDIRLKQFIEIRSADAMPIEYTIAYCALIKGLFYELETVEKYSKLTNSIHDIKQTKENIRKDGWNSQIYQKNIQDLCFELIQDAKKGLSLQEIQNLEPFIKLIENKSHIYKEINYELHIKNEELHR